MTGLNTKEAEIIELLTATNDKLDQIITALGAVPTATKNADDLWDVLTDIHTDTTSMDTKLLAIRNYIHNPAEAALTGDYVSLLSNLILLRKGTVIENNSSNILNLQALLSYIGGFLATDLSAISSNTLDARNHLFYGFENLGVVVGDFSGDYGGYLAIMRNLITLIQGAIGVPVDGLTYPDKGQRDVIQLLEKAAERPESQIGGGLIPNEVCSDAYISSGMVLVPSLFDAWPTTIWAVWPSPPPSDVEFGTVFGIGVDNSELHPVAENWHGWSIYVASSANNFGIFIGADITASISRYPTNVWLDLAFLTTNLSVFVGGGDSLRVWLCGGAWGGGGGGGGPWGGGGGGGGSWGDCVEISSAETVITQPNNSTNTIQYMPVSDVPNATFSASLPSPTGGNYVSTQNDWVAEGNGNGISVRLISGSNNSVRVLWQHSDLSFGTHLFATVNEVWTIPDDCVRWNVDTFSGGPVAAFTVRVCPPGITP